MATATKLDINHDEEPVRLFQSDFLEFFTHITPPLVLIIWVPVVILCLYVAIQAYTRGAATTPIYIPVGFVVGLFLWTLAEYTIHRFVFHFRPRAPWQERITYLFHGIHHYQPQCKTRLLMPPAASIPLALLFWAAFYVVLGALLGNPQWVAPTFAGFIVGYLVYDMIHYATHHIPMREGVWKYLKRHHMRHHFKTPDRRYGVSSPMWDYVFGTQPQG
jgi:sterol desaturase/sphingolipid hydroxylase (fatty acid hydroxylase superfamily)